MPNYNKRYMEVLKQIVAALDAGISGEATSATVTTLTDANLPALGFNKDDEFNTGWVLFPNIVSGADAFPVKDIADYVGATGVVTFTPAFSVAPTIPPYTIVPNRYPRRLVEDKLTEARMEMGEWDSWNEIVSTGAVEYTLAHPLDSASENTIRVLSVYYGYPGTSKEAWTPVTKYRFHGFDDIAEPGRIFFPSESVPPKGSTIRIRYLEDVVTAAAVGSYRYATIPERTDIGWLALAAAAKCVRWRLQQPGARPRELTAQLNDLMVREANARARRTMWRHSAAHNVFPFDYPEW